MSWIHAESAGAYRRAGWWADDTLSDAVDRNATEHPDRTAYVCGDRVRTWRDFRTDVLALSALLSGAGVSPGDRVVVCLPDGIDIHVAFCALERAGATIVGIGAKAGAREIAHLVGKSGAGVLLTLPMHDRRDSAVIVEGLRERGINVDHLVLDGGDSAVSLSRRTAAGAERIMPAALPERGTGPDDLYLINSTSGTTGLPKAVMHTQNRWHYFHGQAVANGGLEAGETILAAVPAPFGFGLWTSHVTPIRLAARTIIAERFSALEAARLIQEHRVTVLCCVSTQFIMMLAEEALEEYDLSSLRVVFTGGEAVPYAKAVEFERRTGATILQFYGSNETGLLSGTNLDDSADRRLRTAGRVAPEMNVRLFEGSVDVTSTGRGQPAGRGPALALGYLDDDDANASLFTDDGWMLMGDICEVDPEGYLTVVGRISEFVVRGGKNISLAVVEEDVLSHPAVRHAAAVAMPDPVLGERVCVFAEVHAGRELDLPSLTAHLAAQGVSRELFPERLEVVAELPRSSGAKVAKGELRQRIADLVAAESATG